MIADNTTVYKKSGKTMTLFGDVDSINFELIFECDRLCLSRNIPAVPSKFSAQKLITLVLVIWLRGPNDY